VPTAELGGNKDVAKKEDQQTSRWGIGEEQKGGRERVSLAKSAKKRGKRSDG